MSVEYGTKPIIIGEYKFKPTKYPWVEFRIPVFAGWEPRMRDWDESLGWYPSKGETQITLQQPRGFWTDDSTHVSIHMHVPEHYDQIYERVVSGEAFEATIYGSKDCFSSAKKSKNGILYSIPKSDCPLYFFLPKCAFSIFVCVVNKDSYGFSRTLTRQRIIDSFRFRPVIFYSRKGSAHENESA